MMLLMRFDGIFDELSRFLILFSLNFQQNDTGHILFELGLHSNDFSESVTILVRKIIKFQENF